MANQRSRSRGRSVGRVDRAMRARQLRRFHAHLLTTQPPRPDLLARFTDDVLLQIDALLDADGGNSEGGDWRVVPDGSDEVEFEPRWEKTVASLTGQLVHVKKWYVEKKAEEEEEHSADREQEKDKEQDKEHDKEQGQKDPAGEQPDQTPSGGRAGGGDPLDSQGESSTRPEGLNPSDNARPSPTIGARPGGGPRDKTADAVTETASRLSGVDAAAVAAAEPYCFVTSTPDKWPVVATAAAAPRVSNAASSRPFSFIPPARPATAPVWIASAAPVPAGLSSSSSSSTQPSIPPQPSPEHPNKNTNTNANTNTNTNTTTAAGAAAAAAAAGATADSELGRDTQDDLDEKEKDRLRAEYEYLQSRYTRIPALYIAWLHARRHASRRYRVEQKALAEAEKAAEKADEAKRAYAAAAAGAAAAERRKTGGTARERRVEEAHRRWASAATVHRSAYDAWEKAEREFVEAEREEAAAAAAWEEQKYAESPLEGAQDGL